MRYEGSDTDELAASSDCPSYCSGKPKGQPACAEGRQVVDCTKTPFVPAQLELAQHSPDGVLEIAPAHIELFTFHAQARSSLRGGEVPDRLRHISGRTLNANVLDHLLADTRTIPKAWKSPPPGEPYAPHICFWGTRYRDRSRGRRDCIRALAWDDRLGAWLGKIVYTDLLIHNWAAAALYRIPPLAPWSAVNRV